MELRPYSSLRACKPATKSQITELINLIINNADDLVINDAIYVINHTNWLTICTSYDDGENIPIFINKGYKTYTELCDWLKSLNDEGYVFFGCMLKNEDDDYSDDEVIPYTAIQKFLETVKRQAELNTQDIISVGWYRKGIKIDNSFYVDSIKSS